MKSTRRPCLMLFLLLIPLLALSAIEPFRATGTTNADRLRVRQEPTLTGETTGSLAVGTDLEILDLTAEEMVIGTMSARWYRIRSHPEGEGIEGWSYGFFIDVRPEDLLAKAIWAGKPSVVQELIDAGANVNARLEEEGAVFTQYEEYTYLSSPLMEAVRAGDVAVVELLVAARADPDTEYNHGESGGTLRSNALVTAITHGNSAIAQVLVEGGANLETEMRSFGGGGDGYHMSPLTAAVERGDAALVEYLLASGADANHSVRYWATFGDGDTWEAPLDIAQKNGLMEIYYIIQDAGGTLAKTE